ncbi:LysR substrate-binding domain-containing protein [Benzoatithermus flavus]|uniref:LysR substrate-binding domain-containing protein n=1 Tax=Benzoatithermus flavus TaxID=3108223 RepID=A0ABU8XQS8_9PROT
MQPTLKQLRYFVALSETLHFGRAAAACNITQPALSGQIRELELQLGTRLVERTPQGAALTPLGVEVARRSREILAAVGDLMDVVHRGRILFGRLRLGVIPTVGPYLVPRLLPRLLERFPALEPSLRESQTRHLLADLAAGQLDVALLALPLPTAEAMSIVELFEDPFVLLVHAGHPYAARSTVHQGDLAGERLLLLEEGHCLRDQALSLCRRLGAEEHEGFAAASLATIVQMVAQGYGVTLLPRLCLDAELRGRSDLRPIGFAPPVPARTLGLVWRPGSPRRSDFVALAQAIRELL